MAVIPAFEQDGLLPPADYEVSFDELRRSVLVLGKDDPQGNSSWDAARREELVNNLETLTRQLWRTGIHEVFADGSFAEDKDHPNDIDGYFVCDLIQLKTGELAQQLNLLDPFKVWTWDPASRKPYRGYPKKQLPMWHRYRVELYHMCRVWVSVVVFVTSTVTNLNSLRRFANPGVTANQKES